MTSAPATSAANSPSPEIKEYAIYAASFDLPVLSGVTRDAAGRQNFDGRSLDFHEMTEAQLTEYEAELLLVEAAVVKDLSWARRKIADVRAVREAEAA